MKLLQPVFAAYLEQSQGGNMGSALGMCMCDYRTYWHLLV